jgi:hypothetical protein
MIPVIGCWYTYFTLPDNDPERLWWDTVGLGIVLFLSIFLSIVDINFLMARLELSGNRLWVRNILGTRIFSMNDFEAFKDDVFYIELIDHDGKTGLKMNGLWEHREIIIEWLESHLRDVQYDEKELEELENKIDMEESLGKSAPDLERLKNVISRMGHLTYLFGVIACLPLRFKGIVVHRAFMTILCLIPFIGLWLIRRYRGYVQLDGAKDTPYPTTGHLIIAPGLFLALRGFLEYSIIDIKDLILPVGIASMLYWCLVTNFAGKLSKLGLVIYLLFAIPYGFGVVKHVNCGFDLSSGSTYEAVVAGKEIRRIRRIPVPFLQLKPWGPRKEINEMKAPRDLYKRVAVGDRVKIDSGPGLLGIPWVRRVSVSDKDPLKSNK